MEYLSSRLMLVFIVGLFLSCKGFWGYRDPKPEKTTMLSGDRQKSKALKSSENRPHPWESEYGPFQSDRFEIDSFRERVRARHREEHSKQVLVMNIFSHPACDDLVEKLKRTCPLVKMRWSFTASLRKGVVLQTIYDGSVKETLLRRWLQCHIAFGRVRGDNGFCPLHLPGVLTDTQKRGDKLFLKITTYEKKYVKRLQELAKALSY